jgi:hypothetical protein
MSTSKIKINPVTKEIEIEVSDEFLIKYFESLGMSMKPSKSSKTEDTEKEIKKTTKIKKSKDEPKEKLKKGEIYTTIVELVKLSKKDGITVSEIVDETGLDKKQIYSAVMKAKKSGVIKSSEKGVYEYVKNGGVATE